MTITMLMVTALPAFAEETGASPVQTDDGSTVIYYEDGSKLTVSPARIVETQSSARATSKTVSSGRDATFTDSDGTLQWKYTLTATFSYVEGVSSTCTNASYTQTIYDSSWTFSDGSATKSGNVATGSGKYVKKILFITVNTYNIDIHLMN
ncbi:MAG: hypothetical protein ACI3XR_07500 [Eubacteriales bacterium]